MPLVTLEEVKAALGLGGENDMRISALLDPVSDAVETYANRRFTSTGLTERLPGGGRALILSRIPVDTAQTITITDLVTGQAAAASDYDLDAAEGMAWRMPYGSIWAGGVTGSPFLEGMRYRSAASSAPRWRVAYTGGPATVPGDVKLACYETIAAQINGAGGIQSGRDGDFAFAFAEGSVSSLPDSAERRLNHYRSAPL